MLTQVYDWLPPELADSYARRYGSRVHTVLGNASSLDGLGPELSPGLYAREVEYLTRHEWARTPEDILWRRTKLGLLADSPDRCDIDVKKLLDALTALP
jgi:glycerol-3-phosphate dehydrogenase